VNETLQAALSADPVSTDIGEQLVRFAEVSAYSQDIESTSESDSIVYYIDDLTAVVGSDTRFRKLGNIMDRKWARKILTNAGKPTWILYTDESAPSSKRFLMLGRNLWSTRDYRDVIGIVTIRLDLKQLRQSLTVSHQDQLV
jgi:two-component system sensor histidine kinase YesM